MERGLYYPSWIFWIRLPRLFGIIRPLANLLLAPEFTQTILDRQGAWRDVLAVSNQMGIAVPAFSASLDYFDSYRREASTSKSDPRRNGIILVLILMRGRINPGESFSIRSGLLVNTQF